MKKHHLLILPFTVSCLLLGAYDLHLRTEQPTAGIHFSTASDMFRAALPPIFLALAVSLIWLLICKRRFSTDAHTNQEGGDLEHVTAQLYAVRSGTVADRMFFLGLVAMIAGIIFYLIIRPLFT